MQILNLRRQPTETKKAFQSCHQTDTVLRQPMPWEHSPNSKAVSGWPLQRISEQYILGILLQFCAKIVFKQTNTGLLLPEKGET